MHFFISLIKLFCSWYTMGSLNKEILMFEITVKEKTDVLDLYFESKNPLVLRQFPSKQKRKYICLLWIVAKLDKDFEYSEQELNAILKTVYHDYVMIRRYLVDYKLLSRKTDGSVYWVTL